MFLAIFLVVLLGIWYSKLFQDILPDFPGYASTLFSNAMVIGQLGGNLLGGAMSHWVGLENVFFVSAASIMLGMILIFFTKNQKINKRGCDININNQFMATYHCCLHVSICWVD